MLKRCVRLAKFPNTLQVWSVPPPPSHHGLTMPLTDWLTTTPLSPLPCLPRPPPSSIAVILSSVETTAQSLNARMRAAGDIHGNMVAWVGRVEGNHSGRQPLLESVTFSTQPTEGNGSGKRQAEIQAWRRRGTVHFPPCGVLFRWWVHFVWQKKKPLSLCLSPLGFLFFFIIFLKSCLATFLTHFLCGERLHFKEELGAW